MGEVEIISVDRATLPTEMLAMFKTHCRVTFNDDDDYLKLCLVRALDLFERHAGWYVFETVALWTISYSAQRRILPVIPVQSFTAADASGADVTADYEIKGGEFFQRKDGQPVPAGLQVTLQCGYDASASLPPSVVDIGFRIGAHLYENRESVTAYGVGQVPQWLNDLLVGNWIPRA